MPRNYFSQGGASEIMGAGENAFDRQTALYDDVNARYTATRAGRRMAQGDRMGASREYANAGLLDQARVLEGDQRQSTIDAQSEANRLRDDQLAASKVNQETQAKRAETMLAVFKRLQTLPAGQRAAAMQRGAPLLQQVGVDPAPFLAMTEDDFSDEALAVAGVEAQKAYDQVFNTSAGVVGVKRDGTASLIYDAPDKPIILGPDRVAIQGGEVIGRGPAKTFAPPRASGGRSGGAAPKPPPGFILD